MSWSFFRPAIKPFFIKELFCVVSRFIYHNLTIVFKRICYYSVFNVQLASLATSYGEYRDRTDDPLLAKQVLSQLS